MENSKNKYLTGRIVILEAATEVLVLFLLSVCLVEAVTRGRAVWPVILGVFCFILIFGGWVLMVIRPYGRIERNLYLFLEGYTIAGAVSPEGMAATPTEYLLMERMMKMMDSSELLKLNKRQAQYLALQNQINPHFLYNTLESIRSEALIAGLDSVADMTEDLAAFFRYTISKVENLVSVEEELQNCETYFRIQQYRFGPRLNLAIECDPDDRDEIFCCRLPKLTMQPILENSIIHGTECKIGCGHLVIRLERTGNRLLIKISDDGVGMDHTTLAKMNERLEKSGRAFSDSEAKGGIALVNVNNRIHLLFGEEYGIRVFSVKGMGTDVEISLPAITNDRELENEEALG